MCFPMGLVAPLPLSPMSSLLLLVTAPVNGILPGFTARNKFYILGGFRHP